MWIQVRDIIKNGHGGYRQSAIRIIKDLGYEVKIITTKVNTYRNDIHTPIVRNLKVSIIKESDIPNLIRDFEDRIYNGQHGHYAKSFQKIALQLFKDYMNEKDTDNTSKGCNLNTTK